MQITNSEYIAIIAVVISIMSLLSALWSARVASKSLSFAVSINQKAREREFYEFKSEFMNELADGIAVVEAAILDLNVFDIQLVNEEESVRLNLVEEVEALKELIEMHNNQYKDVSMLWDKASSLVLVADLTELHKIKAYYYRVHKKIENSARLVKSSTEAVKVKMDKLKNS